jgi:hypothetical protein
MVMVVLLIWVLAWDLKLVWEGPYQGQQSVRMEYM